MKHHSRRATFIASVHPVPRFSWMSLDGKCDIYKNISTTNDAFYFCHSRTSFLSHSLTHLSQIKLNCGREIRYEKTQSERRQASIYVQKITQATSLFYHLFWRTGDGQWTLPELNMIIASASWCEILLSPLSRRQNGRNVSLINAIPFLSFTSPKVHFRFGTDLDGSIAHQ